MKVLHVTPSYYPAFVYGGPIRTTHELNLALARLGAEVRVLTTDANGPARLAESGKVVEYSGVRVHYVPRTISPDISVPILEELPGQVRWADVVHITAVYSSTTIPALAAAAGRGKPVFWSPRGAMSVWEGSPKQTMKAGWDAVCRLVAPQRTTILAASEREAEAARAKFPAFRTVVVGNGVAVPESLPERSPSDELRVVFLGRIHPIKAVENLIDAVRTAAEKGLRCRLTIAGGGDAAYIAGLKQRCAGVNAVFVGEVEEEGKAALFSQADVLVLPSYSENFGMVVAEALAHGVPVIASTNTPWKEVEAQGCGLWVNNSPESLAAALEKMAGSDRAAMGERGRQWMRSEFAWEKQARRVYSLYEESLQTAR